MVAALQILSEQTIPRPSSGVHQRFSLGAAVFVGLLALTSSAKAEEPRSVVTVSPILHDGLSVSARARLDLGFRRALRKTTAASATQQECVTESCWHDLAQTQHAELVAFYCAAGSVRGGLCDPRRHIQQPAESDPQVIDLPQSHRLAVVMYSPVTKLVTSASVGCDACTADQAAERLQGLTETMLQAAAQTDPVGSVQLRGVPAGALIFVDGVLRMQTENAVNPLTLSAGTTHRIEVYASKHEPFREPAFRLQAGESSELAVQLTPIPDALIRTSRDDDSPESPSAPAAGYGYHTSPPAWRWALPLVLIGAGGLLLGLGGRAFALRGTCTDQAGCPMTYNTEQVGMGLLGAGGALVGIGGITLALGVQKVYVRVPPSSSD